MVMGMKNKRITSVSIGQVGLGWENIKSSVPSVLKSGDSETLDIKCYREFDGRGAYPSRHQPPSPNMPASKDVVALRDLCPDEFVKLRLEITCSNADGMRFRQILQRNGEEVSMEAEKPTPCDVCKESV